MTKRIKIPVTVVIDPQIQRAWDERHHPGLTTEQLGELMLATVRQMTPDAKAHCRAKLSKSPGSRLVDMPLANDWVN